MAGEVDAFAGGNKFRRRIEPTFHRARTRHSSVRLGIVTLPVWPARSTRTLTVRPCQFGSSHYWYCVHLNICDCATSPKEPTQILGCLAPFGKTPWILHLDSSCNSGSKAIDERSNERIQRVARSRPDTYAQDPRRRPFQRPTARPATRQMYPAASILHH